MLWRAAAVAQAPGRLGPFLGGEEKGRAAGAPPDSRGGVGRRRAEAGEAETLHSRTAGAAQSSPAGPRGQVCRRQGPSWAPASHALWTHCLSLSLG